jgi:MtfA peptidase
MAWWRSARTPKIEAEQLTAVIDGNVALARRLAAPQRELLTAFTVELLRAKHWEAANEFVLTPEMGITIAANAAIPILGLGLAAYDRVQTIIVRPSSALSTGLRSGPVAGTVSDEAVWTDGISLPNRGPIAISWDVAIDESLRPQAGRNVVIHEFAHKIDMSDGMADGTPPLRGSSLTRWTALLADEFGHQERRPSDQVLRSYAWSNPSEFFAVATETFFCLPDDLARAKPGLYRALADFYHQDPANPTGGDEP